MKSNLSRLQQRMLLVCALCPLPLVAMATSVAADESFAEGVVHHRQPNVNQAVWTGDRFSLGAMRLAERNDPQSFAHGAREHTPSPLAGGDAFSRKGVLNGHGSRINFLSDSSSQNAFTVVTSPVPEPGTYALMLVGLAGLGFVMRRRARS